jgi:hypothetical protein
VNVSVNDSTGRNLVRNEISARKTKHLLIMLAAMFAVLTVFILKARAQVPNRTVAPVPSKTTRSFQ